LMTRMTSDIESLTVLFQEGLVNFAVQIITLLVITAYLIVLNPSLALISLLLVIPVNIIFTLWFRKVSIFGYLSVRDKIADILSNLSESLAGMRVITAFNQRKYRSEIHDKITVSHFKANLYTGGAQALFGPGTEAIGIITQATIL
ncbi:MAG TPA: ABC transporter ATP-binding protein, partial [Acidimicrobiaceae bacterium]|nr:ABC transporter ATP-binding protein [Acidimicrobiaceae bacterium]